MNEGQIFCSKIHGHIIEFDEESPAKFKIKLKAVIDEFSERNSSQIMSFFVGLRKRKITGRKNLSIWSWSNTGNIFNLPAAHSALAVQDLNLPNSSVDCEHPWNLDCVKISTEMSSSMQPKLCDENCFNKQTIICEKG